MTTYLLDVNVLLALSLAHHQHHDAATRWFTADTDWATTPLTQTAYLRLMTNRRVVGYDIAPGQVLDALREMCALRGHRFVDDATSLVDPVIDTGRLVGGSQVTHFHLVNLAATHSLVLATFDASLARALATPDAGHLLVIPD